MNVIMYQPQPLSTLKSTLLTLALAVWPLVVASAVSAAPSAKPQSGCPVNLNAQLNPAPLLGLWRVDSYREINGDKRYAVPDDTLLISATSQPDEVCVEFTRSIEGSSYYYLAIEPDGLVIDDTVVTDFGGELRFIIRSSSIGTVEFVLYNRPLSSNSNRGGSAEGGAVGSGNTW